MLPPRQEQLVARATAARQRAREACHRADIYLQRGDRWLAEVEQRLARAEEAVAANAEWLIAWLSRPQSTSRTPRERFEAARAAQGRQLAYARKHRERGWISRAHAHEDAAEFFALLAAMLDSEPRPEPQLEDSGRDRVPLDFRPKPQVPDLAA